MRISIIGKASTRAFTKVCTQACALALFWLCAAVQASELASELAVEQTPDTKPTILVFGDSLSAAYGLNLNDGWVALLGQRLVAEGYPHRVVNASISGETTTGGIRRLPDALAEHEPEVLVLELGANNGLRGQPIARLRADLIAMITQAQDAGARVLLLGMRIPSNYGPRYTTDFYNSFEAAATQTDAALLPFFLEPIALDEANFLPDGIHPNAAAQPVLLEHLWPALAPLLNPAATGERTDSP